MNHADVKNALPDYLEGDLPLEARAGVDAHLESCAACSLEVSELQETVQLLRQLPDPEPPPMIAADVMRRIRSGETAPNGFQRFVRGALSVLEPSFVLPASAIAAAALVAVVVQDPSRISQAWNLAEPEVEVAGMGLQSSLPSSLAADAGRALAPRPPSAGSSAPGQAYLGSGQPRIGSGQSYAGSGQSYVGSGQSLASGPASARPSPRIQVRVAEGRGFAGRTQDSRVRRVAQPLPLSAGSASAGSFLDGPQRRASAGGEDPRDEWLSRGLADPVGFARFIANKNLAEQELWIARLGDRAQARGLLNEIVATLRASGDVGAAVLSDDFAARAETLVDGVTLEDSAHYER